MQGGNSNNFPKISNVYGGSCLRHSNKSEMRVFISQLSVQTSPVFYWVLIRVLSWSNPKNKMIKWPMVLKKYVLNCVTKLISEGLIFQEDNDPKHPARA